MSFKTVSLLLIVAMLLLAAPARSATHAAEGSRSRKLLQGGPSIDAGFGARLGPPQGAFSSVTQGGPLSSQGSTRETTTNVNTRGNNPNGPVYGRLSNSGGGPSASNSFSVNGH